MKKLRKFAVVGVCIALITTASVIVIFWLSGQEIESIQRSLPSSQQLGVKEKAELINRYRATWISGIGTLATSAGGIVLYLNFMQAADKTANDKRLAESRLAAEQFTTAAALLSDKNAFTQICGIYSLERLAEDFPEKYGRGVIRILSKFIQRESFSDYRAELRMRQQAADLGRIIDKPLHKAVTPAVQTAITTIGNINSCLGDINFPSGKGRPDINLSKTNLMQADLQYLDLSGACLEETYLERADLRNTELRGAKLSRSCLDSAKLTGAKLEGTDLSGCSLYQADMRNLNLRETILCHANLYSAKMNGVTLSKGSDKLIGAKMIDADLSDAVLKGTDLSEMKYLKEGQVAQGLLCGTKLPSEFEGLEPDRDCNHPKVRQLKKGLLR